jgi:predicted nuclease of predicted toxin-antitoxin system
MRFLVDANLSPRVAASLSSAGFDSIHVADVGLLTAADQAILDYALETSW